MSTSSIRSSRPDAWSRPRSAIDPSLRLMIYGPLVPMDTDQPRLWRRLFGLR